MAAYQSKYHPLSIWVPPCLWTTSLKKHFNIRLCQWHKNTTIAIKWLWGKNAGNTINLQQTIVNWTECTQFLKAFRVLFLRKFQCCTTYEKMTQNKGKLLDEKCKPNQTRKDKRKKGLINPKYSSTQRGGNKFSQVAKLRACNNSKWIHVFPCNLFYLFNIFAILHFFLMFLAAKEDELLQFLILRPI